MPRRPLSLSALLAASVLLPAPAFAANRETPGVTAWKDEVIYLVMTDRFYDGDKQNDTDVRPGDPFGYHGGDLEGVIQKLDYIKGLGATAIWLTPVSDNQDGPFMNKYWGYHGYWISNFDRVDEHLGTMATYRRLVNEAHARGLKVIQDAVANHTGYDAPLAHDPARRDWFHHNGSISDWNDTYQNENYDLVGLPDFNSENKDVLAFHEKVWGDWITRTGIDGYRMDTVRHVSKPFWIDFTKAIKQHAPGDFLMLGEVSYHRPGELAPYLREAGFDSVFDFPLSFTLVDVFAKGQSMRQLADRLEEDVTYPDAGMLATFLDNHDYPRFLTVAGGDVRKLRLGLAALMTLRGIPTIYYGTETGMTGGQDPENRHDMAWGQHPELTAYVRQLTAMRREVDSLRRGATVPLYVDDQAFAFARVLGADQAIVALNNGDRPKTLTLTLPAAISLKEGTVLPNQLGTDRVRITGRTLIIKLQPYEAKVFARP